MDDLVIMAVMVFYVLSLIGQARKKKQKGRTATLPDASHESESQYEPDWSYDEPYLKGGLDCEECGFSNEAGSDFCYSCGVSLASGVGKPSPRSGEQSSESMIPDRIWEEILDVVQGPTPNLPEPGTTRQPPSPTRTPRPPPEVRAQIHRVHSAHRAYGTDPSTRPPSEQDGLDPLAVKLSADVVAVRRQLRSKGGGSLRQAVMLTEILGLPAAVRPDRFDE